MQTDALGKPIVFGQAYGYSNNANGRHTVVVGTATKETPKQLITLEVISRRNFLYGEPTDAPWMGSAKTVSVNSCILFPVTL